MGQAEHYATSTLKSSHRDKALWLDAARAEGVTLSEWMRRAATVRLARVTPPTEPVAAPTAPVMRAAVEGGAAAAAPAVAPAPVRDGRTGRVTTRAFRGTDFKQGQAGPTPRR